MPIHELIAALLACRLMKTRQEVLDFDDTLAQLGTYPPVDIIAYLPTLFQVFDDSTQHEEVMWGLVHFLDIFDTASLFRAFAEIAPVMSVSNPEWTAIFLHRMLNHDASRAELRLVLPSLPIAGQSAIRNALAAIATDSETTRTKVSDVLG